MGERTNHRLAAEEAVYRGDHDAAIAFALLELAHVMRQRNEIMRTRGSE